MPFFKTPYKYGNLFIVFKIKFPEKLKEEQVSQVEGILSAQKKSKKQLDAIKAVDDVHKLEPFNESQKNTHAQGGTPEDH